MNRSIDPYLAFRFAVSVRPGTLPRNGEPVAVGGFNEVSGLALETEVETIRAGGVNDRDVMLPGPSKYPTRLVLRRGLADRSFLWEWYLGVVEGRILRQGITVTLQGPAGSDSPRSWTFNDACPIKWSGPSLQAGSAAVAFESIELIHRGLDRHG
jgi:phage tail-like protein